MSDPKDDEPKGRLDFIRPRMTPRIKRARVGRMARFMRHLRIGLPVLAISVLLLLYLWPSVLPGFKISNIVKNIPDLVVDNLHYSGVNDKNEPYTVRAAQATRPASFKGIYDLVKPEGDITMQSGAWLDGKADKGRYDEIAKKLWLGGNVRVFHNKGYQITSEEAKIDLKSGEASGDKSVLIQGPFGTIRGTGFHFLDSGHTVIIKGPATALVNLHRRGASDKSPAVKPLR